MTGDQQESFIIERRAFGVEFPAQWSFDQTQNEVNFLLIGPTAASFYFSSSGTVAILWGYYRFFHYPSNSKETLYVSGTLSLLGDADTKLADFGFQWTFSSSPDFNQNDFTYQKSLSQPVADGAVRAAVFLTRKVEVPLVR
jgi:hypothetical protein